MPESRFVLRRVRFAIIGALPTAKATRQPGMFSALESEYTSMPDLDRAGCREEARGNVPS